MYFDIHSHLNLPDLFPKRQEVIAKMKQENVSTITVGTGLETSRLAIQIAEETNWWATIGIHPLHVDEETLSFREGTGATAEAGECLLELAQHEKVVAIGECGFDYYYRDDNKVLQEEVFRAQIELAQKVNKPLMIHARPHKKSMDAYLDVLDVVKSYGEAAPYTHFHFFSGDIETAKKILDSGYSISVDGPITFVSEYDEMIKFVPLDRMMAETDSPYAAPVPYRGQQCEPWMVKEVYKRIGEIKQVEISELKGIFSENAKRVFGL